MLNVGDRLQQGRYQVNRHLGAGGMATVYEVFDERLQTTFALKAALLRSSAEQALFMHEALLLAQLSHPSLPKVIDTFREGGLHFLVMELVPGDDLEKLVTQQAQPFSLGLVLRWADQLLDALEYLHQQSYPIIHRDIKPANLKIDGTGRIKLLDFGIAKQQVSGSATATVAKAVSLHYSPPEQFSMNGRTDARSDVYSTGATLYYLLTGQEPTPALARQHGQALVGPDRINPACPLHLTQMLLQALALDPEQRFQTAAEFRAALHALVAPLAVGPPQRSRHIARWVVTSTAATAVLIVGYLIGSLVVSTSSALSGAASTSSPGVSTSIIARPNVVVEPSLTPLTNANPVAETSVSAATMTISSDPSPTSAPIIVPNTPVTSTTASQPLVAPVIISRSGWGAGPAYRAGVSQRPRQLTLSHDAQPMRNDEDPVQKLRSIQSVHQRRWSDIAWHFIIDQHGVIYEGRPVMERGDTGYHYDTNGIIAIGVLGDYDTQEPSQQQIDAITRLMAWLCQQHALPPNEIYPHSYFANQSLRTTPKITSPGRHFNIDAIRQGVTNLLAER